MTTEEKARAYDETLERAKLAIKDCGDNKGRISMIESIFPELGESEDEKTKRILHSISSKMSSHLCDIFTEEEFQCFDAWSNAWLEKRDSKESEDEKIRYFLINFVKINDGVNISPDDAKKALDWLEKQGIDYSLVGEIEKRKDSFMREKEKAVSSNDKLSLGARIAMLEELLVFVKEKQGKQKPILDFKASNWYLSKVDGKIHDMTYNPADKVEPKFKDGDWIIHQGTENIYQVVARIDNQYQLKYGDNYTVQKCADVDRCARLWDITKDAKEGDVLEFIDHERVVIGIVSFVNERTRKVDVSCLLEDNKFKIGNFYTLDTINPHPATKEQCDTLERVMTNAGYRWNKEELKLEKI